jgi:hypothetical protein
MLGILLLCGLRQKIFFLFEMMKKSCGLSIVILCKGATKGSDQAMSSLTES